MQRISAVDSSLFQRSGGFSCRNLGLGGTLGAPTCGDWTSMCLPWDPWISKSLRFGSGVTSPKAYFPASEDHHNRQDDGALPGNPSPANASPAVSSSLLPRANALKAHPSLVPWAYHPRDKRFDLLVWNSAIAGIAELTVARIMVSKP